MKYNSGVRFQCRVQCHDAFGVITSVHQSCSLWPVLLLLGEQFKQFVCWVVSFKTLDAFP